METTNEQNEIIKAKDVASLLCVDAITVYHLVHKGVIPAYRIGPRTIRFKRSEVLASLKQIINNATKI